VEERESKKAKKKHFELEEGKSKKLNKTKCLGFANLANNRGLNLTWTKKHRNAVP
jgi:hypothetical protein